METTEALLRHIGSYLDQAPRAACDVENIGPFAAYFRRGSEMPELSYARPAHAVGADADEQIAKVRAAFTARGRACRWEFVADLFPDLPAALERNGFPPPSVRPLMLVTPDTYQPAAPIEAEVRRIARAEAQTVDRVLEQAFDYEPDGSDDSFLGGAMDRDACVMAAFLGGAPVAAGVHNAPIGETTEIVAVGTHPGYRRRGMASGITSALVEDAFAAGCRVVFLSAADESVQRIYARLGFRTIGTAMDTTDTG